MNAKICVLLLVFVGMIYCRDFYMGMFKRNDFLVAQDRLFKEKVSYRRVQAKYLKVVHCPITYLRVVDRLGVGAGPEIRIVRGGISKNHIYLYITSQYNQPISVMIYIGCPNYATKKVVHTTKAISTTKTDISTQNGTETTSDATTDDITTDNDATDDDTTKNDETELTTDADIQLTTADEQTTDDADKPQEK